MLIRNPRSWEIPENQATPEAVYWNRRSVLRGLGGLGGLGGLAAAGALAAGGMAAPGRAWAAQEDPSASLYPFSRDPKYVLDRPLTDAGVAAKYNNFYEFGSDKQIARRAQKLRRRPWKVVIDGWVENRLELDIDDLISRMPLSERLYRHRCVEAWSMAVPWSGFPMKALVELARPLSRARYVRMETFEDSDMASGQKQFWYPWPYVEGLTIEEATNELSFLATGIYGRPLPRQHGAPLRLAVPWKYGFKSIKSIVRFIFTDQRPKSFWEIIQAREYGFWANVNPDVPHPRWSQATERVLGTDERVPTLLYNGYGEQVAGLYAGVKDEQLFR